MAQYKVPQDVEADDKLLGPFTFRQFVYLMITGGCVGLCFAFFQVFPLLAIAPVPFAIFFAVLALPLKKDQPMETYLAAVVAYHLRPNKRFWNPGQRDSTIKITAPKVVEQPRARNITGEEASTRLSFLANVIDTEGNSLRSSITAPVSEPDIFESAPQTLNQMTYPTPETQVRHAVMIDQMHQAFETQQPPIFAQQSQPLSTAQPQPVIQPQQMAQPQPTQQPMTQPQLTQQPAGQQQLQPTPAMPQQSQSITTTPPQFAQPQIAEQVPQSPAQPIQNPAQPQTQPQQPQPEATQPLPAPETLPAPESIPALTDRELAELDPLSSPVVIAPDIAAAKRAAENKAKLAELANNKVYTVATIAKEANRIEKNQKDNEVYISLH